MSIATEPFSISRKAAMSCGVMVAAASGTTCGGFASGAAGYDGRADFNADSAITIADFSLLAANFGQAGQN